MYRVFFSALACVTVLLRPFQSVIPPAGSAPDRLRKTARPVPPHPACTKAAASPAARRDSSLRTTIAKVRDRAHIHARVPDMLQLIYKCNKNSTLHKTAILQNYLKQILFCSVKHRIVFTLTSRSDCFYLQAAPHTVINVCFQRYGCFATEISGPIMSG